MHHWYEAIDVHGSFIRVLLLDYSKAFDLINHDSLINKLFNTGISPLIVRGVASFLKDRSQRVKVGRGLYMGPNNSCCVTPHFLLFLSVSYVTFYKNFTSSRHLL